MVWIIELLACIVAFFNFISDWQHVTSAPQQCVAISMALLIVILPYCFCRAITGLNQNTLINEIHTLNEQLATHTKLLASIANATLSPETSPTSTDVSGG